MAEAASNPGPTSGFGHSRTARGADRTVRVSSPFAVPSWLLSVRHIERRVLPSAQLSARLRVGPAPPHHVQPVQPQPARSQRRPPRPIVHPKEALTAASGAGICCSCSRRVLAQLGPAEMSAIWPLSGAKRTLNRPNQPNRFMSTRPKLPSWVKVCLRAKTDRGGSAVVPSNETSSPWLQIAQVNMRNIN